MVINLTSTADTLTFIIAGKVDGVSLMVTDTSYLKAGSWTTAVLKHPGVFSPSPQKLTAAKTAGGPGSKIKYTGFWKYIRSRASAEPLRTALPWIRCFLRTTWITSVCRLAVQLGSS